MPDEIRVVVDTDIIVSGLIHEAGPPGRILTAFRGKGFDMIFGIV